MAAIGDQMNDFEMICEVGFGVAMANAVDEVKASAKWITGSNDDDGVAEFLELLIRDKLPLPLTAPG